MSSEGLVIGAGFLVVGAAFNIIVGLLPKSLDTNPVGIWSWVFIAVGLVVLIVSLLNELEKA